MNTQDTTGFEDMRGGLVRDYAPATEQELLLVHEVAAAWCRLDECRHREVRFFEIQRDPALVQQLLVKGEMRMWIDHPHRSYDQIMRSIRDSQNLFDRAVRRIEEVKRRRLIEERHRARAARKAEAVNTAESASLTLPGPANYTEVSDSSRVLSKGACERHVCRGEVNPNAKENVSTQQPQTRQDSRISRSHEDQGRSGCSVPPPGQGPLEADSQRRAECTRSQGRSLDSP